MLPRRAPGAKERGAPGPVSRSGYNPQVLDGLPLPAGDWIDQCNDTEADTERQSSIQ